jgi:hypothetical protein
MLFILEFLFLLFTPHTYATEHVMILWPLTHVLFFLIISSFIALFQKKWTVPLFSLLSVGLIISQLYVNIEYLKKFNEPTAIRSYMWTPIIYKLSEFINKNSDTFDNVISIDFGTQTPLFALAKNNNERAKFHEFWFLFTATVFLKKCAAFMYPAFNKDNATNQQWVYEHYYKKKINLVVMYTNTELARDVKQSFYQFTSLHHLRITPITIISDDNGRNVYSLYKVVG